MKAQIRLGAYDLLTSSFELGLNCAVSFSFAGTAPQSVNATVNVAFLHHVVIGFNMQEFPSRGAFPPKCC